jgi:hypothetical protein
MRDTDLLDQIRSDRGQKRLKRPFRRARFERISALVRRHGLDEEFVKGLEGAASRLADGTVTLDPAKAKVPFEPPVFSLCSEAEYRVAMSILEKVTNPYLDFVNSPDEILLCQALFDRNPRLAPDELAQCHFEALLARELAGPGEKEPGVPDRRQQDSLP